MAETQSMCAEKAWVQVRVDSTWYDDETHIQGYTVLLVPAHLVPGDDIITDEELTDLEYEDGTYVDYLSPEDLGKQWDLSETDLLAAAFLCWPTPAHEARRWLTDADWERARPVVEAMQRARAESLTRKLRRIQDRQQALGLSPILPPLHDLA